MCVLISLHKKSKGNQEFAVLVNLKSFLTRFGLTGAYFTAILTA